MRPCDVSSLPEPIIKRNKSNHVRRDDPSWNHRVMIAPGASRITYRLGAHLHLVLLLSSFLRIIDRRVRPVPCSDQLPCSQVRADCYDRFHKGKRFDSYTVVRNCEYCYLVTVSLIRRWHGEEVRDRPHF